MRLTFILLCVMMFGSAVAYDKPPSKYGGLISDKFGRTIGQARPGINGQIRYYDRMGNFQGSARPGIGRYTTYDRFNRRQMSSPSPVPPQSMWMQMLQ